MDTSVAPVGARRISPDLDLTWELASEFSLSDSDATTSGLAGPGRTLGLAYEWAGGQLEGRLRKQPFARNWKKPNESTDSLSTNATADNLPGPGRTLGLAYGWGGLHLERRLNKFAEKFGYGPKAAEDKLIEFGKRYHVYVSSVALGEWSSQKAHPEFLRDKSARKAGKRLLKYSKSQVEATQMQALNGIIDLCYKEPFLRDFFFELSGVNILQEVHASSDTDHLLSSSRKALVFLSDAQVSSLFSELRYRPGITEKQYTELTGHLLDPYSSFIVLRFLVDRAYLHGDRQIFQGLLNLVERDSDYTDWKALDSVLSFAIIYRKRNPNPNTHCLGRALIPVLSHAEKLPRSTVALKGAFTIDITASDEFLSGPTEQIGSALEYFTGSDELDVHIAYATKLETSLRQFVSPWHKELEILVDEPIVIFCHIFCKRRILPRTVYRSIRCERAVDESEIAPHCRRLLGCLNSAKEDVRFRAWQVAQAILGLDRYCAMYFLKAFDAANRGRVALSPSLVPYARDFRAREFGVRVAQEDAGFLRHSSVDGMFHVSRPGEDKCLEDCQFNSCSHLRDENDPLFVCKRCRMGREYKLPLNEHALLWLHHDRGAPFDTSIHHPILVGTNQSGVKGFIALVDEGGGFWTTVGESDIAVRYLKEDGVWRTTENYYVPVLRFDLSELKDIFPDVPDEGLDPTGPFYWKSYDAMYELFEDEDLIWTRDDLLAAESSGIPIPRRAHAV